MVESYVQLRAWDGISGCWFDTSYDGRSVEDAMAYAAEHFPGQRIRVEQVAEYQPEQVPA